MFVGADLTATKLGPKNFKKNLLCDGHSRDTPDTATFVSFVDDFWGPLTEADVMWAKKFGKKAYFWFSFFPKKM
jgi:hypothetical protein